MAPGQLQHRSLSFTSALLQITFRAWIRLERLHPRPLTLNGLKWILCILIALNFKSWPLVFHLRLSRPVFRVKLRDWWHALRVQLSPRLVGQQIEDQWLDRVPLVGTSPFDYRDVYRTRATFDECDYNVHLSNSSYSKVLDIARFETVVRLFPLLFRCGAGMALGASHFHFIREIPAFDKFEIRTSIGSWDHKWIYLVSKFVSQSRRSTPSRGRPPVQVAKRSIEPRSPQSDSDTDSGYGSSNSTPDRSTSSSPQASPSFFFESDGSLVHTVVVTQLCFKAGRITIPPSVVLASNGFCQTAPTRGPSVLPYHLPCTSSSPRSSPSPNDHALHWPQVKQIASPLHGGSLKKLFAFYSGEWRDVPEREKWWDSALGGYVEVRRSAALAQLARLKEGLECARCLT
ncbi:hypothetical protein MD484_g1588, partial [Candolleomyces efflorescens]